MFNRLFALIIILILSPIYLIIAIAIAVEDGFPILFKQKRVGVNNIIFIIYKFRSMRTDTPNVATHLLVNPSQYLLKTGSILRKLSLDELPNLLNIVKGEMVFVGPRPSLYNQYDLIELRSNAGIDKLKPGITGWAQINGRDNISNESKVELEKYYMYKKTFYFDLKIIIITFMQFFNSKNISH